MHKQTTVVRTTMMHGVDHRTHRIAVSKAPNSTNSTHISQIMSVGFAVTSSHARSSIVLLLPLPGLSIELFTRILVWLAHNSRAIFKCG